MQVNSYSHIVTSEEINKILLLGYQILGIDDDSEHDFINRHFPNFDLFKLLEDINTILTPFWSTSIEKTVYLKDSQPPEIIIAFLTYDYSYESTGLVLVRTFTWEQDHLIVKHDFFRIPVKFRRLGIAKNVFKVFLQQYVNMGVQKIKVLASLADGGYVWALNYFTATNKREVEVILESAQTRLSPSEYGDVEQIFNNYYTNNPHGTAFPIQKWAELPFMVDILRGSSWNGAIDLNNSEQFSNFMSYVFR